MAGRAGEERGCPPPIERDPELERLDGALDEALAGRGRAILIEGPAGIGKSLLLGTLGRRPDRQPLELAARGGEIERRLPYGIVRQLLEPGRRGDWPDSGPAALVAAMLDGGVGSERLAPDREGAMLHAFYCFLGELADERGLLLRVDDLHQADDASLRALAYLAARLDGHPVLLAAAARPPGPESRGDLLELRGGAELLELRPLSGDGCARFVATRLGAEPGDGFSDACREATGGNPQLLEELLAEARRVGLEPDDVGAERIATLLPREVVRSVALRLERLPAPARALAGSVAVLERAELRHAAAHAGLDDKGAAEAVAQLVAAGLLGSELPLEYAHPILREAAYAEIPAVAADLAHRRAARLLADEPRERGRAAAHLLSCEPSGEPWAAELLGEAGMQALRRGAPGEAAAALERAIAEGPQGPGAVPLRGELGLARLAAGDLRGVGDLELAIEEAGDADSRAALIAPLAEAEVLAGRLVDGVARMRAVLDDPGTGRAAAVAVRSGYLTMGRQVPQFAADVALRLDAAPDDPDPGLAGQLGAQALYSGRSATEAIRLARVVVREADDDLPAVAVTDLTLGAHVLAGADAFEEAEAALGRSMRAAARIGSAMLYGLTLHTRLFCRQRSGDLRGALADAAAVLELSEGGGLRYVALQERALLAEVLLDRGEPEEAAAALRPCFGERGLAEFPGTLTALVALLARARLGLETATLDAALEDARRAGEVAAGLGIDTPAMAPWRGLAARALAGQGEAEEGRRLAEEELEAARAFGAPRALGVALMAAAATEPDADAAIARLERSAEALDGSAAQAERARAYVELGAALRRAHRRADSRPPLREALELAHSCGATAIASRARDELEASGARLGRERLSGVESLTPRERQLAELAAEGLTNPQIAARAFVARKTVETHLSAVYRKLGIGSREQLAEALDG